MLRKIAIIPSLMAMMMVLFTMFVPHHHHQAMICLVHEVCLADGCCDDEHTSHSDANHEEDESHCVSREKYCPSDDLRLDVVILPPVIINNLVPAVVGTPNCDTAPLSNTVFHSPPLLTWRINC